MKWFKILALLLLTLAAMRAASWALAWLLTRFTFMKVRAAAIVSNAAAFLVFLLFLYTNLLPGEPIDWTAVAFGLIVFALYALADLYRRPWRQREHNL